MREDVNVCICRHQRGWSERAVRSDYIKVFSVVCNDTVQPFSPRTAGLRAREAREHIAVFIA